MELHPPLLLPFFFSSRRRHTRWTGDWSSDVCSSDLGGGWWRLVEIGGGCSGAASTILPHLHHPPPTSARVRRERAPCRRLPRAPRHPRSEERRVGKECRSRCWR